MSKFVFEIAKESDNPALNRLLADNPMGNQVQVAFQTNPNYFCAITVQGKFNQVIVCREKETNKIIGFGTRCIKPMFINGNIEDIGYLSNLRSIKQYRGGTLLARGYNYLRQLHQDKQTPIYLTTIIDDNKYAKDLLTSKRSGLPTYYDFGVYHTHAIICFRRKKEIASDIKIIKGSPERLDEILECIYRNGKLKQFYSYYKKEDFISNNGFLRDFHIEDFYVALKDNRVVGVMAKWDQNKFKQAIIVGYKSKIRMIRPFFNLVAKTFRLSQMPSPGSQLNSFYISFIAIDSNDLQIFYLLLRKVYNDAVEEKYAYFLVGLHEKDPLLSALKDYWYFKYNSRLYIVFWEEESFLKKIDNRIPYLEIGAL